MSTIVVIYKNPENPSILSGHGFAYEFFHKYKDADARCLELVKEGKHPMYVRRCRCINKYNDLPGSQLVHFESKLYCEMLVEYLTEFGFIENRKLEEDSNGNN